ncbi:thiamine phosphate synthase [Luteimicrobium subarcticum]|uniref:Thiamine-phosphate synthase n=1 Tax=Luteimicrobium subarcticum TaxID=620910 RepID=A0A2M8WV95_9MICO|nr:thiamine phosphate synthase [Luteimicrobium subarcticum]PJI94840.1 thiamine-phosphate diphosphorylase [Luteimicrobium subarcticum]
MTNPPDAPGASRPGSLHAVRLGAARLYLCTDAREASGDLEDFLDAALRGGVDVVQLRDRGISTRRELELLELVADVAARHGALWAVNDRADLAALAGAPVLHTGQDDLPVAVARRLVGPDVLLGRSTHADAEASAADADPDVDYFCVGPVWPTPTKAGRPAVGLDLVRRVAASGPTTPWFAIGGIDEETVHEVVAAGARRVVVVRAVTAADDPEAAARHLRAVVTGADR